MNMINKTWCILVASALLWSGCGEDEAPDASLGELSVVEFRYQRSCFFGCPLEQPLLAGTREKISVTGPGDATGVTARSTDTDVVEFAIERQCFCERQDGENGRLLISESASCDGVWSKHCDNDVLVQAVDVGEATLELIDGHGKVLDRVELLVREADQAIFSAVYPNELGSVEADVFELSGSEMIEMNLQLYDADGFELLAPEAVNWSVADEEVAIVNAWLIGRGASVSAGLSVIVEATGPGDTELAVEVPGLSPSVTLNVAD